MLQKRLSYFLGWFLLLIGAAVLFNKLTHEGAKVVWFALLVVIGTAAARTAKTTRQPDWIFLAVFAFLYAAGVLLSTWLPILEVIDSAILFFGAFAWFSIFAKRTGNWWAILLAGLCFTQATALLVCNLGLLPQSYGAFIFFFGSGLTFVYLKSTTDSFSTRPDWRSAAALGCFVMAAVALVKALGLNGEIVLAGFLLAFGIYLIARFSRRS
ncbi:MAG: hypothetical protein ONB12_10285 [candidate division KSB1 bacterium]|nr:hypothetical protein [candidate division KSB1 bacterium]